MMNQSPFPMNMNPMMMGPMAPWGMPMKPTSFAPPLYVGDLDESIHEELLYDIFSKYGPLHFVRIMRDSGTGKSRGYAFVNFVNPRDAETAKQCTQYEKLGRKYIRIMFKRNVREMPTDANIFVKNIDPNVIVKELHQHFASQGGSVLSAKISTDHEGRSLGYGYVQFEKAEDAQTALKAFNGLKLKEKELDLSIFLPREQRPTANVKRNIYVRNLPDGKTEDELNALIVKYFEKFGEIESKMLAKHKTSGLYSAFVCFKDQASAQQAITELNAAQIKLDPNSEPLYVNWHQAKVERQRELGKQYSSGVSETNLFLKNLKMEVTSEQLKTVFNQFGNVTSCAVKEWKSKTGKKNAAYAFVAFSTPTDASNAMNEAMGNNDVKNLFIPGENAYIQRHQSKEKRAQYLVSERRKRTMQFNQNMSMQMYNPGPFMNQNFRRTNPFSQGVRGPNQKMPHQGGMGGFNNPRVGGNKPMQGGQRPIMTSGGNMRPNNNGPRNAIPPNNTIKPKAEVKPTQLTAAQLRQKIDDLAQLPHEKQRQILGELLFPKIQAITPELAPKITGMLIDLEIAEVIELLEDQSALNERIEEAKELLAPNK